MLVIVTAVVLCIASVSTSRGRRAAHAAYASVAVALIVAALLGAGVAMLLDLIAERRFDLWMALAPLGTLLPCLLPLWRARQARRLRDEASRDRQRSHHPGRSEG